MSSNKKNARQVKKPLSHGWIVVPSKTYPDRVYFYNTVTKCSTWSNPCETRLNDSDSTSPETTKASQKNTKSQSKKQKDTTEFVHVDESSDIEDYDEEQDQYFDHIKTFSLSHSNLLSPPASPGSPFSFNTNISDSDSSKSSLPVKKKKQLWLHFASSPDKPAVKKSVALSDLEKPSTSTKGVDKMSKLEKKLFSGNFNLDDADYFDIPIGKQKRGKRKKKKERKKSQNVIQKQKEKEKSIVSFKRRDRTPAQSRLLKFRQENANMLKSYTKQPNPSTSTDESNVNEDTNQKLPETYQKGIYEINDNSMENFMEEMDWEPSNEESDVININVFRRQQERGTESPQNIFGLHTLPQLTVTHSWLLVLDTNIFVSCLNFVKELRDTKISGDIYPVIYVPWRVLQELDHLKDSKFDGLNKHLHRNVRHAIAYLNDNFKSSHPRCIGQSFEDYSKMVEDVEYAPDDEILQTCIQLQKLHPEKKLTLLTNDKNLESKAIVSRVEAYSKEGFQKKFFSPESQTGSFDARKARCIRTMQIDKTLCEVKNILKKVVPVVVETEMKIAFQGDWMKLSYKKPPWTLQDAFDCMLKHWRAVFFLVFNRETESEARTLYEKLFRNAEVEPDDVREILRSSQLFFSSIQKCHNSRPYSELIDSKMSTLYNLLRELSPKSDTQVDSGVLSSSTSSPEGSHFHAQQISQEELNDSDLIKVKNLFRDIWDSYRGFCCSISDLIHSSISNNNTAQELRLKLSQTQNQLTELILLIEKLLESNPQDMSERHPLINHLTNFLIVLCPSMEPELKNRLPLSLTAFFMDIGGRSLVNTSLNDFREFSQDLTKASEYFESQLKF